MTQWDADKAFDLAGYTPVLSALATLCWVNEYAFYCTDEEEALVKKLEERIVSVNADDFDEEAVALLYLYSCHNAANRIEGIEGKIKKVVKQFGSAFERFVQLQISDYFEEQRLKQQIRQLTAIDDAVSTEVRAMYEESPYPRRNDFWLLDESKNLDMSSYDVLFAGCGTGHQVLGFLQLYRNSKFTGVDLSLSSLAFATRLARQKKKNVTYAQADILKLDRLPKKYDRIYCTGVLHHMDDPEKGLAVLKNILKPGGVMRLAYYSEAARQDIVQARAYIAEHGYEATTEGIRRFRHDMMSLQLQGKAPAFMSAIFNQYDFYTLSECRDLLFHVQEHRYTLPQITDMLERHDLELISFNIGSKNTLAAFMKEFPTADINDPAAWHEFEQIHPMTFIGMYDFNVGHKR